MGETSKLVVLCDDLWCGRSQKTQTNIYMLARLMGIRLESGEDSRDSDGFHARYFDGPGLGNTPLDLFITGSRNPTINTCFFDIYQYIVEHFSEKYEIWMFGLGNGAYVVSRVADMIKSFGIVKRTRDDQETANLVKCTSFQYLGAPTAFPRGSSWDVMDPIRFMGLLDTTDPAGWAHPLLISPSQYFPSHPVDPTRLAKSVYQAMAVHERLSFFKPYLASGDNATVSFKKSDTYHEVWFPGMHYDLGRHSCAPVLGASIPSHPFPWFPWRNIRPNLVLSDFVMIWMLEAIQAEDSSESVISSIGYQIHLLRTRLGKDQQVNGYGDIYARIRPVQYLIGLLWMLITFLFPGLRGNGQPWIHFLQDRKIPEKGASAYNYRMPLDQSGATVEMLAKLSKQRYPSTTYEEFQAFRRDTNQISQSCYECLLGCEGNEKLTVIGSSECFPLTMKWQGPQFYDVHSGDWKNVLIITKISSEKEYYIARTIPEFLNEFFGDVADELLNWVTGLCVMKRRVSNHETDKSWSHLLPDEAASETLDQVHLHVEGQSITAHFADTSLRMRIPEKSRITPLQLLSALSWLVSVFQTPNHGEGGLFKVTCKREKRSHVDIWSSHHEPFTPGKLESSCWTQLFNHACIAEKPQDLSVEIGNRLEGLEIDFELLVDICRASRPWFIGDQVVLFGFDTALIQLTPVASRRWHVVRTPGKLITPMEVMDAIKSSMTEKNEVDKIYSSIQSFLQSGNKLGGSESSHEATKSVKAGKKNESPVQRAFEYRPGKVYVGWCDNPTVTLSTAAPDADFLHDFDQETTVPVVSENILALSTVSHVQSVTLSARLGFLGSTTGADLTNGRTQQTQVQQTAASYQSKMLTDSTIHAAEHIPFILWDDTIKRAWLLPGVSALLFVSICQFRILDLHFERDITYVTSSSTPGASAKECLRANWDLRLVQGSPPVATDITFGNLVLDTWNSLQEAQRICYSNTDGKKHAKRGYVFGYDIHDVLGTGQVQLRYLNKRMAGRNFQGWEPLAEKHTLHVIFCKRVGSVIQCDATGCAGVPCQQFCHHCEGTEGVLSCLLPDMRRYFGSDWRSYAESGVLPVTTNFEWIPTSSGLFNHLNRRRPNGGVCECCADLDRLQTVVRHAEPSFLKRTVYKVFGVPGISSHFRDSDWLEKCYGVRFGSVATAVHVMLPANSSLRAIYIAISPDNEFLASYCINGTVELWDLRQRS